MSKYLLGNPYDPSNTYTTEDQLVTDLEKEVFSSMGTDDIDLVAINIAKLANAVMALAYEQRTANLISVSRLSFAYARMSDDKGKLE